MPSVTYSSSGKPSTPSSTAIFSSGSYTVPAGKVGFARVSLSITSVQASTIPNSSNSCSTQTFTVYAGQVLSLALTLPTGTTAGQFDAAANFQINGSPVQYIFAKGYDTNNNHWSNGGNCVYVELYDQ